MIIRPEVDTHLTRSQTLEREAALVWRQSRPGVGVTSVLGPAGVTLVANGGFKWAPPLTGEHKPTQTHSRKAAAPLEDSQVQPQTCGLFLVQMIDSERRPESIIFTGALCNEKSCNGSYFPPPPKPSSSSS